MTTQKLYTVTAATSTYTGVEIYQAHENNIIDAAKAAAIAFGWGKIDRIEYMHFNGYLVFCREGNKVGAVLIYHD